MKRKQFAAITNNMSGLLLIVFIDLTHSFSQPGSPDMPEDVNLEIYLNMCIQLVKNDVNRR